MLNQISIEFELLRRKLYFRTLVFKSILVKTIKVQSLPLYEVIRDIADCFGVEYEENCGEYHLTLPKNIGEGFIKGINFDGGFGILIYQCNFHEDIEFQFVVDQVHPLKFLYCLAGKLKHRFQKGIDYNVINQYQSSIVASQETNGHILHFNANTDIQVGSLEIDRSQFQHKIGCELKSLSPELKELFKDQEAHKEFYHNGFYSLQIADLFRKIETFENNDFIRRIFLEGQAYQILTHQIIQYHDDLNDDENRSLLRQSEIELINKAARMIESDIENIETIDAIAEKVGVNVNKLQEGFKYTYNLTVNGFIQKSRLELAKKLLANTDYNISEVVSRVGLSSKSYFSKIFKEEYQMSPSDFKKNNNKRE